MFAKKLLHSVIAAASFAGFAGSAFATACGTGLDTTDVAILRSPTNVNATTCIGADKLANANAGTAETYVNGAWGGSVTTYGTGNFTDVIRDENPGSTASTPSGGTFGNWTFNLNAIGTSTGTFALTITDNNGLTLPNFPVAFDLVVALSGGSYTAAYLFDNLLFSADTLNGTKSSNSGTFEIAFTNNGGNFPNLSHLDILVRNGEIGTGTPAGELPEPGSIALLGVGLLALRRFFSKRGEAQV